MAPGFWLAEIFSASSLKPMIGLQLNWTESKIPTFSIKFVFVVLRADLKSNMAALASTWLSQFRLLLWNRWTKLNETGLEARSQRSLPSLCFSGRSENQDGRPSLWLAETFLTSSLKQLYRIQRNFTVCKIATSSTTFVLSGRSEKTKMAALASNLPRYFRLLLWYFWTKFNETSWEARSQCPLPRFRFSGEFENQNCRAGLIG